MSLVGHLSIESGLSKRCGMVDSVPSWLATMRAIDGTLEAPGSADNPVILSWSDTIARAFPDMASYASGYKHDSTAWCGQTLAYVMAANGIRPPYDPSDELKSYLWVDAWDDWGTSVSAGKERPGDVLVFSSPHHITLYEGQENGFYLGRGGNQSDSVRVSRFAKSGINTIRRPPSPSAGAQSGTKPVPAGSTGRFHSLIGGFYSSTPMDKSSGPVAIRMNNPGAINGAAWERAYPGYVSEVETTPGNRSTIFETPEHGVAAWYELMRKYRSAGATTVGRIINRYGGGQDYSGYIADVAARTGLSADHEIALEGDDPTLLKFAKAMFRHEAGRETPLSDAQILYGFKFAREYARTGQVPVPIEPDTSASEPQADARNPRQLLLILVLMMLKEKLMSNPAKPSQGIGIEKLLFLLLQSAFTGKKIDTDDLLSMMVTGNPGASGTYSSGTYTTIPAPLQQPIDINALLLRLLYQVFTGKAEPGQEPAGGSGKVEDPPAKPDTPAMSKPSVQLSVAGLAVGAILQALGIVGTPFNISPATSTLPGTLTTLIPLATAAIGATGGFGALGSLGLKLLSGFARRPQTT